MPARFTSNHLYPTSDGKPMAETDRHRRIMVDLIESLKVHFADDQNTYVTGNLLLFYDRGNKRRDVLRVKEYFLFDPYEDYLSPSMQGYRLRAGQYVAIRPQAGRLPSQQLGLHLERDESELRLWNPASGERLPTVQEIAEAERQRADDMELRADAQQQRAEAERARADAAEAELARLRGRLQPQANGNGKHS